MKKNGRKSAKERESDRKRDLKVKQEVLRDSNYGKLEILIDAAISGKIIRIDYKEICFSNNIRSFDRDEEFELLVDSIRKDGVLQPLLIEVKETNDDKVFSLSCIAGHRRAAAFIESIKDDSILSKKLKDVPKEEQADLLKAQKSLRTIQCKLKLDDDLQKKYKQKRGSSSLELALKENMLREDMHCLEIGESFSKLIDSGLSKNDIAASFDKSSRMVHRYLKLAEILPASAKDLILRHKKVFTFNYLVENFVENPSSKKRSDQTIINILNSKINPKPRSKNTSGKITRTQSKVKKLITYFDERKITETDIEKLKDLLDYIGYLKADDFPSPEKISSNPYQSMPREDTTLHT